MKVKMAQIQRNFLLLMVILNFGGCYKTNSTPDVSLPEGYTYTPTPDKVSSITVNQFVTALNRVDGRNADSGIHSYVQLYTEDTIRSSEEGEDQWFVIWDDKYQEHKAVSLDYVRSIVSSSYVDDYQKIAEKFREKEDDNINRERYLLDDRELYGDYMGDDYEFVDYDTDSDSYSFWGRNSGHEYEDETETTDVNLIAAESQEVLFYSKATRVSFEFNVNLQTAVGMVTLGAKISEMNRDSEISAKDMEILSKDLTKITGVTATELMKAAFSKDAKDEALEKAAKTMGTSAANIEQKLLPALGINL
jgi:hypothetical protein